MNICGQYMVNYVIMLPCEAWLIGLVVLQDVALFGGAVYHRASSLGWKVCWPTWHCPYLYCFLLLSGSLFLGLKICLIFRMSSSSWYDFFHLDGTHPVKVEPLLKSKVWIIIFLFDYWFKGLEFRMRNILKQKIW